MNCPICKHGNLVDGTTTLIFEKNDCTVIMKMVPADVCNNCGEKFVDEPISKKVYSIVTTEFQKGIELEVLTFAA